MKFIKLFKICQGTSRSLEQYSVWDFPGGSVVKSPLTMQETPEMLQTLGRENPLEEEMAMHSGILAWKIP